MRFLKLLRVKQWIKNIFVLVPLFFSGQLILIGSVAKSLLVLCVFCLVASFIYIINDILDKKADLLHPIKKLRPITSGQVRVSTGVVVAVSCLIIAIFLLYILYNKNVVITIIIYILCNILYSWKLKFINLIDVFCVAVGFVLRIYCGAFAINIGISDYLFLVVLFLSLFLVFSKRKVELKRIQSVARISLKFYTLPILDKYTTILANATIITYVLYVIEVRATAIYSIVFVIYGIFRYINHSDKLGDFEDPTDNLYRDKVLLVNIFSYLVYMFLVIYS